MTQPFSPIELTSSSDNRQFRLTQEDRTWQCRVAPSSQGMRIVTWEGPAPDPVTGHQLLDALFAQSGVEELELAGAVSDGFDTAHPAWRNTGGSRSIPRVAFYQIREHWLDPGLWPVMPEQWVTSGQVSHPRRPAVGDQVLYRRLVPALGKTVTLRRATVAEDGERFHCWQNDPRAARFWEYPWGRERLDAMLEERRADPHALPLILEADGEAVGYFETYYVPEDRLGPYCDARPHDQGMHVLIGERRFLGEGQTIHWLNAVSHFLFLAEPRTHRLWGEPRADNRAMLRYTRTTTWEHHGEFDFPHKRAVLLCNPRERFFSDTRL
ncbi:GNAT family N-acetyltransferase [Marinobacter sp.]|uniref:GNAT family N-acetyltransferase n=1 Tax=Marinobacter sp. TaxID=50741 RepID=UPI003566C0C1